MSMIIIIVCYFSLPFLNILNVFPNSECASAIIRYYLITFDIYKSTEYDTYFFNFIFRVLVFIFSTLFLFPYIWRAHVPS